jgi:threonine aldolase
MSSRLQFASDNYAGICPEVMEAIAEANQSFASPYGNDDYTALASKRIREFFGKDCEVFFVFNGTSANSLAISACCQSYHSIVCHELSHIETDECGAPEFFSNGTKILTTTGKNGKLDPKEAEKVINKRTDIHYPKPQVISITQPTEAGTVYSIDELREIEHLTKKYNLKIHMDGARFVNALAHLNCHPSEITWKVGVDVLCFGGTKSGMMVGEAIVFFDKKLAEDFAYRCKQAGQLASKMRYISAQWLKMLENNNWLKYAKQANEMANYFYISIKDFPNLEVIFQCQANAVFVKFTEEVNNELLKRGWQFYNFIGIGYCRFMFSWNSQKEVLDELIQDIRELCS